MYRFNICNFIPDFLNETFFHLKESKAEIIKPWIKVDKFSTLSRLDRYELENLCEKLPYLQREKWDHLAIDKIGFIIHYLQYSQRDLRNLLKIIDFKAFEILIKRILILNNYHALNNFRFSDNTQFVFKTNQKRYEVDCVGYKGRFLILIDAKKWHKRDAYGAINKAANLQYRRAQALVKNPQILGDLVSLLKTSTNLTINFPLYLIPLMVTYEDNRNMLNQNNIPLVSIAKFQSFLNNLDLSFQDFCYIKVEKINLQKRLI